MKRTLLSSLAVMLAVAGVALAQSNPRGKAEVEVNGKKVTVEYGRPSLKGRTIQHMLGQLPAGKFWRLGADKSTTFTTSGDLHFGKVTVPKGIYSLFARKEANNKWSLVFNKQHGQWGIKGDEAANLDPKLDVASVPLEEKTVARSAEMVTITLAKAGMDGAITIQWGDMELKADFK
jgi:Protein of unknown function (DUF2911)